MWEPNQELNVLNALQKINEVMQNSGCSLKEALEVLYGKIRALFCSHVKKTPKFMNIN